MPHRQKAMDRNMLWCHTTFELSVKNTKLMIINLFKYLIWKTVIMRQYVGNFNKKTETK